MMSEFMMNFGDLFWATWLELAPWLLLGAGVAGLMHVLLPANFIHQQLRGAWAPFKAVFFGIPLPLCSCGVIPAAVGLKRDGASDGATVGFLIATPQTGVDSFFVSASMLGWPFALFKVVAALLMGLVGGYATEFVSDHKATPSAPLHANHTDDAASHGHRFSRAWSHGIELIESIAGWLVAGVVISVLVQMVVPESAFQGLADLGILAFSLAVLGISMPLYVCATGSIPIAAALVAGGLPPSAALIFLTAGPATSVATLGAISRTLGRRPLVVYLLTIIIGSVALAWLFEDVITVGSVHDHGHQHGENFGLISILSGIALAALMTYFAGTRVQSWIGKMKLGRAEAECQVDVEGMTCGGCARKLEQKLRHLPGVDAASVSYDEGRARIKGPVSTDEIHRTIVEAGYRVKTVSGAGAPS